MFMCVVHQKSVNKLDLTWKLNENFQAGIAGQENLAKCIFGDFTSMDKFT